MSRSNVSCSFYCLTGSRPSIVWSSIHFREITVTCQSANGFLPRWQSVTLKYSEKPFERLGFIERIGSSNSISWFLSTILNALWSVPLPSVFLSYSLGAQSARPLCCLCAHKSFKQAFNSVELAFSPCWGSVWWGRGKENLENGRGHRVRSAWGT